MASRVNIKFVIILSAVLFVLVAGLGVAAYTVVIKSAGDLMRMGRSAADAGEWAKATELYGKAFAKDRTRVDTLDAYIDALQHKVPITETELNTDYMQFVGSLEKRAQLLRTDIDAHDRHLNELYQMSRSLLVGSRSGWESLMSKTDDALAYFDGAGAPEGSDRLRRYRGLAALWVRRLGLDIDPSTFDRAKLDLEAALATDPDDEESAVALVYWHAFAAQDAQARLDRDGAGTQYALARGAAQRFVDAHPDAVWAKMELYRQQIQEALRALPDSLYGQQLTEARAAAMAPFRTRIEAVLDELQLLANADAELVTIAAGLAGSVMPVDEAMGRVLSIATALSERAPDSAALRLFLAQLHMEHQQYDDAIATYESISQMPDVPVSLRGRMLPGHKRAAAVGQVNAQLGRWESASDESAKSAFLEQTVAAREHVAGMLQEKDPALLLIDAKLAITRNETTEAERLLVEFNKVTADSNVEGLKLLAGISQLRGNRGEAQRCLERVVFLSPTDLNAIIQLADIAMQLRKYEAAAVRYEQVLKQAPDNALAAAGLQRARAMLGVDIEALEDPIAQVLIRAQNTAVGSATQAGDDDQAMAVLSAALQEHGPEPRLAAAMARMRFAHQDKPGAIAALQESIAAFPDNATTTTLLRQLTSEDPVAALIEIIDESEAEPLVKLIQKHSVYNGEGNRAKAAEMARLAESLAPRDFRVVELAFSEAMLAGDLAKAAAMAQVAAETDSDHANGLIYRARLLLGKGEQTAAEAALLDAVEIAPLESGAWRLLGMVQLELGRGTSSLTAFRRALESRPDDLIAIKGYIRALAALQQTDEALRVARSNEAIGRGDEEFVELWLQLEGRYGDQGLAVATRENMRTRAPNALTNNTQLANLYIMVGRFDDARTLINELRSSQDSIDLVALDAQWYSARNDVTGARQVWVDYISNAPSNEVKYIAYIRFGAFMVDHGYVDQGLAALEQAQRYQARGDVRAELVLGQYLYNLNRLEDALRTYRRVVDAGQDPDESVRRRTVEILNRLGQFDEADALLKSLKDSPDVHYQLLLLRAETYAGLNDPDAARRTLDEAIASEPNNPMGFIRRAQLLSKKEESLSEALEDVDRALEINPSYPAALRLRAALNFALNRVNDAVADLRKVLRVQPDALDIRFGVIRELLARDRESEALDIAASGIDARPNDLSLAINTGAVFASLDRWDRAARFFEHAWGLVKSADVAVPYVESLLRSRPPGLSKVEAVLATPALGVDENPDLLMHRARLGYLRDKRTESASDVQKALALCEKDSAKMIQWFEHLEAMIGDKPKLETYLANLMNERGADHWLELIHIRLLLDLEGRQDEAVAKLEVLNGVQTDDRALALAVKRAYGQVLLDRGSYQAAVDVIRGGLAIFADDASLNNNLAYVMSEHLSDPENALPYARRAARLAPTHSGVQDTLGWVQYRVGSYSDAVKTLRRSLTLATGDDDKAVAMVHLARALVADGKREEAARLAAELRIIFERDAALGERFSEEAGELNRALSQAG